MQFLGCFLFLKLIFPRSCFLFLFISFSVCVCLYACFCVCMLCSLWFVAKATWGHSIWSWSHFWGLCHNRLVEVLLPQNSLSFATIVEVWVVFFPYPSHLVASHLNPPLLSPCNIASPSLWTCLLEHSDLISFSFSCEHMFCKGKRLKKKQKTQPRLQHHQGDTFKIAHQPNANCIRLVAGIGSSRQQSEVIWERPCLTQISTPRSVF